MTVITGRRRIGKTSLAMRAGRNARREKEANEIDIVALAVDGKNTIVAEVKRQQRNYDHKLFMEKVDHIKTSILSKYDIETRLLTLDDM